MKGKWAAGIPPRHLTWVLPDRLAASERPGGHAVTHRKVRRQEEIIWLRENGFSCVISLLATPQNLAAYEELGLPNSHHPIPDSGNRAPALTSLFLELARRQAASEKVLVHHDELGDRTMGAIAGYLLWTGRVDSAPLAITVIERLFGRQLSPDGRELVAQSETIPGAEQR